MNQTPDSQHSQGCILILCVARGAPAPAPAICLCHGDVHGARRCYGAQKGLAAAAWYCCLAELLCCICACLPTENWHCMKAFINGDMLTANFHKKNYRAAISVTFVYKYSFVVVCCCIFPSFSLPPFLGNDHRAPTSHFLPAEILSLFLISPLAAFIFLFFFS